MTSLAKATDREPKVEQGSGILRSSIFIRSELATIVMLLLGVWLILFLANSRMVNIFDEGILLTDVLRTMAGQVLHRDFYWDYGPGQLYMLAGLFKVFGPSVFADRLSAALSNSVLAVTLYVLTRKYCGRALAFGVVILSVVWIIGLMLTISAMNALLCTLTFWICWLILPVADKRLQRRRALWAGFMAGVMFLFRYDIGVSIAGASLTAIVIMMLLWGPRTWGALKSLAATVIGPYIAAFVVTILPFAIAYLSVAPLQDLVYDTVIYMAKYYRLGRGLPFPPVRLGPTFRETAVYLVPIIIVLGLWLGVSRALRKRTEESEAAVETRDWVNLLVTLSIAAAVVCVKGLVRVGIGGMYGSVAASLLIAALLLKHRGMLSAWLRGLMIVTVGLFILTGLSAAQVQLLSGFHLRPLAVNWILTPNRQPPVPAFRSWCHEGTPITRGFCFLLEDDRIQTVRYVRAHTAPGDFLYVGLNHHDRIIANDMVTYFATERLPAVKWAQLDPFLENRADVQREMIAELEQHKPPYVVLDSEFDAMWEPNGSSVSTGVHLLDDYIAAHYHAVQKYGKLTIEQRDR